MGRLKDKVIIVTGGGSGLGAASCHRFAQEGAAVVVADIDERTGEYVAEEIARNGGRAICVRTDVTSESSTEDMATESLEAFGAIDGIYCNAGIPGVGTAKDLNKSTWDHVIGVLLTGVWLSMRAVLPAMEKQRSGSIVNQSSVGGLVGVNSIAPYAAAKAGVIGLTRQAAADFAGQGIRVNAVCPGLVVTPLAINTYDARIRLGLSSKATVAESLASAASRYPIGRLGEPLDVANVALFLASDESKWITGQVFVVDGGYTAV